jgi:UDP-N-acetylglucosamine--N-acetylmuramyl-(pentapeptide) pyrophosphoryl-undecaprenol N-acetylglucosamine transferase
VTCAELEATGTPAVLVPYPHHADRQQYANAAPLVGRGGALLLEESALRDGTVRSVVLDLLLDPGRCRTMAAAIRRAGADGAGQIAADLVRLLEGGRAGAPPA